MSQFNRQYIAITDNYTNGNRSDAKDMIAELTGNRVTDFIRYCVGEIEISLRSKVVTKYALLPTLRMCMHYALNEVESRILKLDSLIPAKFDPEEIPSDAMIELVDSHYGVYIPQSFAERYSQVIINNTEISEELGDILEGPDNEYYLDSWETVCNKAKIEIDSQTYYLWQNDDLWAIKEGYSLNDNDELIKD